MPNITLTYRCNLRCPYCFAHEFVGGEAQDITLENFEAAVEFLTRKNPVHLGIIGGEPTLHPHFGEILQRVIDNPRITSATIYTNGILLGKFTRYLIHPKFSLLINWNAPEMLGDRLFDTTRDTVDELIFEHHMQNRINLGLNLHDSSLDYSYMSDLLVRYRLKKVRISITVPNFPEGCDTDVLASFDGFRGFLMKYFKDMDTIGVLPYYDCNRPPYCLWNDEEKRWLEDFVQRHDDPESSLVDTRSFCRPVIDILPDLQAVRCFGMSFFSKVKIAEFGSLEDLIVYFMRLIDRPAFRVKAAEQCENCHLRRTWQCSQGCMGYKARQIRAINREELLETPDAQ